MINYIKKITLFILNLIKKIRSHFRNYTTPAPLVYAPGHYAYQRFINEELSDCYEYFKKYFYNAIFLPQERLRKYAIESALKKDPSENHLYLEFGVYTGKTTNFFSSKLKKRLYGFDSFEGFNEDWLGHAHSAGDFSLNRQTPDLNRNVSLEIGWVQDTLSNFLKKNMDKKINFVHMDMDTYKTSKFILENIKPNLVNGAIICFDELYNFEGWKVGEFKALTEIFSENEFIYKCFSNDGAQVVVEYVKQDKDI